MASSFRFIYWRVCCYICTREPKRNQRRKMMMRRQQLQQQQLALQDRAGRFSGRSQGQSMRRSIRTSQRSADSGIDPYYEGAGMSHAYSDMDCRYAGVNGGGEQYHQQQQQYYDEREKMRGRSLNYTPSQRREREQMRGYGHTGSLSYDPRYRNGYGRNIDRHTVDRDRFPRYNEPPFDNDYDEDIEQQRLPRRERMREREDFRSQTPPRDMRHMRYMSEDRQMMGERSPRYQRAGPSSRVQSLDRRMHRRDPVMIEFEQEQQPQSKQPPMFCNKYACDDELGDQQQPSPREVKRSPNMRSQSMPRQQSRYGDRLMPPQTNSLRDNRNIAPYNNDDIDADMPIRKGRKPSRPAPSPSPRIMSPMGFAIHRQARHLASIMDENSMYGDNWDYGDRPPASQIRPVPIWLCVFLVIGYIIGGGFLFQKWEGWNYLDSVYFCFITLTTIGFGDIVPNDNKANPELSIALCSIYLLFGIALLAMSFNLVQEEVIAKVKHVARRLGIIKDEEVDD
ncbi:hypothetical protein PVAND_003465 [Polypedilum vanderplanki]|uniref:Potassium channel domain-containing protein n=1 Tax=Polypedilum vanderplanki TaxID=319348 RepID=A0A9J6BV59_POLVA|nr:hypothetical protein PVAND_003465 [Polypedilum vanderplanki]